jgi:hypothetical protein
LPCIFVLLVPFSTARSQEPGPDAVEWTDPVITPGQGEQCLVCRKTIGPEMNAVTMTWRGRTFSVGEPFFPEFQKRPELYLARLQPKAALFQEESASPRALDSFWLFFGLYVLAGLVAGAETAYLALSRGRKPLLWFAVGLLLNVVGVALVLLAPRRQDFDAPAGIPAGLAKIPTTHAPLACIHCGSPNHPSASACSSCGQKLEAKVEAESARA